ncbi:MAG: helix-turn-helix domain-containing protein [Acidimicrobiales bacterium]
MTDEMPAAHDRVKLDPRNLRGMAHPLRVRLLGLLRLEGPSTATKLAERLGQSSGATSYHLRQLATYGFVDEDPDRPGGGRERWWRATARFTELPRASAREAMADAEGFLRALANECYQEMDSFLAELPSLPPAWDEGWTISDRVLRLTPAEAKRFRRELAEVVARYRLDEPGTNPDAPRSAKRVVVRVQVLPRLQTEATP